MTISDSLTITSETRGAVLHEMAKACSIVWQREIYRNTIHIIRDVNPSFDVYIIQMIDPIEQSGGEPPW